MYSTRSKRFALAASALLLLSSCATPRIAPPSDYCSPIKGDMLVCNTKNVTFPKMGEYLCFEAKDLEPYFNQCGER